MYKPSVSLLFLFSLTACTTTAVPIVNPPISRTYDLPRDKVWSKTVEYFATVNMPISAIEKDSGIIAGQATDVGSNRGFTGCAAPFMWSEGETATRLNAFVKQIGPEVKVTVTADFKTSYIYGTNVIHQRCQTSGVLEKAILDFIGAE